MTRKNFHSIIKSLIKKSASDNGETLITSLLLWPVCIFIIISVIDVGLYFMTDATMAKAARDGAETAATLGGTGTHSRYAPTEQFYAQRMSRTALNNASARYGFTIRNTPENMVAQTLDNTSAAYGATVSNINCRVETGHSTSTRSNWLGNRPECRIYWSYDTGLPLSTFGLIGKQERTTVGTSTADYIVQGDSTRGAPRP